MDVEATTSDSCFANEMRMNLAKLRSLYVMAGMGRMGYVSYCVIVILTTTFSYFPCDDNLIGDPNVPPGHWLCFKFKNFQFH